MPDAEVISLWRCSDCGKWSHARRRPSYHKRLVLDDDPILDDERRTRILQTFTGYELETGAPEDAFYIACGPFIEYRAEAVNA